MLAECQRLIDNGDYTVFVMVTMQNIKLQMCGNTPDEKDERTTLRDMYKHDT